VPRLR